MPRLEDLLKDTDKEKLLNYKHMEKLPKYKPQKAQSFIGQTPNLNSSLGVNAADGDTTVDPSKADTFWVKNQNIISGLGSSILGAITGSGAQSNPAPSSNAGYVAPPPITPSKKILGMPVGVFVAIIILVVIIVGIIIYKKSKSK
jgi:hypothetical protein